MKDNAIYHKLSHIETKLGGNINKTKTNTLTQVERKIMQSAIIVTFRTKLRKHENWAKSNALCNLHERIILVSIIVTYRNKLRKQHKLRQKKCTYEICMK